MQRYIQFSSRSLVLLLVTTSLVMGQKAQPTQPAKQPVVPGAYPDAHLAVYRNAMSLQDYATAISALHYILAANPTGAPYADTLALVYAQTGQFVQAGRLAEVQLAAKGYSDLRMEVKALANSQLKNWVKAIDAYGALFEKTQKPVFGFEKLKLEYDIKRMGEAALTAEQLLKVVPATDSSQLQVAMLDGKQVQTVAFRAGLLNLQGLILLELKKRDMALAAFNEALKLNPDFEQAKNNLTVANAIAAK
ncbi:tetratricopeptide repeat protein [Spirosoma sp.]|uniref:tetratricopeptide repeat protein n=1 Tax=Spirosoma sp. TaxID=1899569 RepID=UPI002610C226|nr:tetratricopeptide repeat protein [Spirosoma sp.]MCX6218247.1 tetratricopeptide repeat protein [Spirosoma sp.]